MKENPLTPRVLRTFLLLCLLAGLGSAVYLLLMPLDTSRGRLVDYGTLRTLLLALMLAACAGLGWLAIGIKRQGTRAAALPDKLHRWLNHPPARLFRVQGALLIVLITLIELWLLTFFSLPVPLRPGILWAFLACALAWLTLRRAYTARWRERKSLRARLKDGWQNWSRTQRQVFLILAVMGLLYFLAFFPVNYGGRIHPDEDIIYPDVVAMLIPGETFTETLRDSFIVDSWWYGYPYFPISALALVIPRLIYGNAFAEQVTLNMLLLRQFVSVLPMIIGLLVMVYVVDRFRSPWISIGLAAGLAAMPGVLRYNTRFWHPDGIIVLLTALTFFFLQRDRLRFGRNYYLAAAAIGLNAAIKVWGLFFFLAIGGYLLAGLAEKKLDFKKAVTAGLLFILVMAGTILITSPSILIPWNFNTYLAEMQEYYPVMRYGYDEPDPQGVYRTGLPAWMVFFRIHAMPEFFFWFATAALALASLLGSRKTLARLILAWCAVVGTYLVAWIAVKSFQYLLPLMIPLYAGAFLLPSIAEADRYPPWLEFLAKPETKRALWAITAVFVVAAIIANLCVIPVSLRY